MSLEVARRVLTEEAAAIARLADAMAEDERFATAVDWILNCRGRVVCCGIGKSGHIARKTAGTLSSTGTPSLFLHAAEAEHGDLGAIAQEDVVLAYTHSGETEEIVRLFPAFRESRARTMVMTSRPDSSAARLADLVLETHVTNEACSLDLAPTTSTTAMLALSDALAVAVMDRRGFSREDFARLHPSGTLGKRLLTRVSDVMRPLPDIAVVSASAPVLEVMRAITQAGVGAACVLKGDALVGLISDGDLRRHFLNHGSPFEFRAEQLMTPDPTTVSASLMATEALEVFQNLPRKIGEAPVVDDGHLRGLLMIKDLLRSGIV